MGAIRIEPEPPAGENPCETCGGTNRLLHGYVYDDECPHGVYFLEWCDGDHPQKAAFLTIGLGDFSDETDMPDRHSFCVEWRANGMRLTDDPARDRPDLLCEFVPRETALERPEIGQFWHVADHIVLDDPRIAAIEAWINDE